MRGERLKLFCAACLIRGMHAELMQSLPQIDKARAIQAQMYNRRTPRGGDADHLRGVRTPGKMRGPSLLTGMKQGHITFGGWVAPHN